MQKLIDRCWKFFSSLGLAVFLLILIAVASIFGTLIPQQEAAQEWLHGRSPSLISLFQLLQLHDIFRSVWFVALLGLLSLNLLVCSAHRLPAAWKLFRSRWNPCRDEIFQEDPEFTHLSPAPKLLEQKRLEKLLRKDYRRVGSIETAEGIFVYGEKGAISHLGAYIIHLGILVIILGALIGIFFGFKGFVNIMEGERVHAVNLSGGKGLRQLGFTVQCDKFTVEFYETGQPKLFRSDVTFRRGNQVLRQGTIMVNHPLEIEGIRFYQSSYGTIPEAARIKLIREGRELAALDLPLEAEVALPGAAGQLRLLRLESNFMQLGPAAKLEFKIKDKVNSIWIFQHIEEIKKAFPGIFEMAPVFDPARLAPYNLVLEKLDEKYYTGLQVNRDPGAYVVGFGAILMVYGLIVAFFYPRRQFVVRLKEQNGATLISLAGKSPKDTVVLNREMRKLMTAIRNG